MQCSLANWYSLKSLDWPTHTMQAKAQKTHVVAIASRTLQPCERTKGSNELTTSYYICRRCSWSFSHICMCKLVLTTLLIKLVSDQAQKQKTITSLFLYYIIIVWEMHNWFIFTIHSCIKGGGKKQSVIVLPLPGKNT